MKNNWNTQYISSYDIDKISRGKSKIAIKYLKQFQQLIPARIEALKAGLLKEDRQTIRKVLHNTCPQLQFFGMQDIVPSIKQISASYQQMTWTELEEMTTHIIDILEKGAEEVAQVLRTQY